MFFYAVSSSSFYEPSQSIILDFLKEHSANIRHLDWLAFHSLRLLMPSNSKLLLTNQDSIQIRSSQDSSLVIKLLEKMLT